MFHNYADVLFQIPLDSPLSYQIPPDWPVGELIGRRVVCELRGRSETGIIIREHQLQPAQATLVLQELLDPIAILNQEQLELAKWMAGYYLCAPGQALFKMFPGNTRFKELKNSNEKNESRQFQFEHDLNAEQKNAWQSIRKSRLNDENQPQFSFHLLHGITGSGKTEVYIHCISDVLGRGATALLLVPEISLTVQLIERLSQVFGRHLALMHSALTMRERQSAYMRVLQGDASIVVGTRSAVFAPLPRLGLIVIDEEHDGSFKEHSTPRYDARQIAWYRARQQKIPLLCGSATPRLESRMLVESPKADQLYYYRLQSRATGASLPRVQIVSQSASDIPVGPVLLRELETNFKNGEKSLILLNRRGYQPYVICRGCEQIEQCPSCSVSLNLHRNQKLICHYCGYSRKWDGFCHCERREPLRASGSGTQKLEEYLLNLYPDMRLERLDSDVSSRRGYTEKAIRRLIDDELDVLLGTQMIAKGLDAPGITLVGVLQADASLGMPDYRAQERCFSLLTQVAGRSGRGQKAGRVVFECLNPKEEILALAARQDYDQFFQNEIPVRQALTYPPFGRLLRLLYRSSSDQKAHQAALELKQQLMACLPESQLKFGTEISILGPVQAPLAKINKQYRYHLILKSTNAGALRHLVVASLAMIKTQNSVYLEIDVDPVDLL